MINFDHHISQIICQYYILLMHPEPNSELEVGNTENMADLTVARKQKCSQKSKQVNLPSASHLASPKRSKQKYNSVTRRTRKGRGPVRSGRNTRKSVCVCVEKMLKNVRIERIKKISSCDCSRIRRKVRYKPNQTLKRCDRPPTKQTTLTGGGGGNVGNGENTINKVDRHRLLPGHDT